MKANRLRWLLRILVSVILLVVIGLLMFRGGIRVTIHNAGGTPNRSVVVHVTGASHFLGDISPGSSAEATVKPYGKSNLEIEFVDANGTPKRLNAGGNVKSGYQGKIQVSIKDGAIEKIEQQIHARR